ncbi:MAG TPA: aminotransferase class III-fold pyridoxal phosphate-dependent enzyme [Candidatus Thermoplasmatota archaeon]|nr:aminotransferase class III-fold pyridoxal phosphate-dependent enzyme [Candidatus Thermoplasmatota archaeon]
MSRPEPVIGGEAYLARSFPPKPVSFVRGAGHELFTADGTAYVDLGGASHGVANFGHNHPRILQAIHEQAHDLVHTTMTIPSPVRAGFLDKLHRLVPGHLERTFLANSGTEAVEAALKHAAVATGRSKFVALRNSFHGRTLGALSATFRPQYRKPFHDLLIEVDFVAPGDEAALELAVDEDTAAILVEPVQGEGGLATLSDGFLRACQRIAHAKGALLVVDEIQTGLGRTGTDLAVTPSGAKPDLLLLGKSLAGGLPIGTCSMTADVAGKMPAGGHGNTFGGSPLVCAAASAALDVLREERLAERARTEGEHLRQRLASLGSPLVREVRGKGLMLGLELRIKSQPVLDALLRRRMLALAAGPTVVRMLPPLATPRPVLDGAVDALGQILADPALAPQASPGTVEAA